MRKQWEQGGVGLGPPGGEKWDLEVKGSWLDSGTGGQGVSLFQELATANLHPI